MIELNRIYNMDCMVGMKQIPDESIDCCVTSPPYYGLRDYGIEPSRWPSITYSPLAGIPEITEPEWEGVLGMEPTINMFIAHIVHVFREVYRVLKKQGTLWVNFGDSYCSTAPGTMGDNIHIKGTLEETKRARKTMRPAISPGLKPKDLMGIPWRVAFALQADGWLLRQDDIWHKPNPMPESVKDRCTKAHEYIFLLTKAQRYYFDAEAIKEPCVGDEYANGFRGGAYCDHETIGNETGGTRKRRGNKKYRAIAGSQGAFGQPQSRRRYKVPGGWETEKGAHGTIHRYGRTEAEYADCDVQPFKNKRSVWTVAIQGMPEAHFATFPEELIEPCILDGCPIDGIVLDMFMGSGTTGKVAKDCGRNYLGFDIKAEYVELANRRTSVKSVH